jgi:hypothetical protein
MGHGSVPYISPVHRQITLVMLGVTIFAFVSFTANRERSQTSLKVYLFFVIQYI